MPSPRQPQALADNAPAVFVALYARWRELNNAGLIGSVSALCAVAGISRTTWYSLQDPNSRPARATVAALAQVLDMDADHLLRLAGFGPPITQPPASTTPEDGETER